MSFANGLSYSEKCSSSSTACYLSGWNLIEYVLFCNAIWWISYVFLILVTKQTEEWCCRALTLFHGCMISFSAISDIIANGADYEFQCVPLSETQKQFLSFMLSYFLFDFCWIHFFGNEAWIIYFHHITSIIIIIKVFMVDYGGAGVSYGVAGLEFTNPYLQLRWFLRTHGYLNSPIHTAVELWFFFTFFVIRMVGGTILFYYTEMKSSADIGLKLAVVCIYAISVVLQWQILMYVKKKYLFNGNSTVHFINSRVSISPYFQRRTLDPPPNDNS